MKNVGIKTEEKIFGEVVNMESEPRTKIMVIQEMTLQQRQYEPVKISLMIQYAYEPFATAQELRDLFRRATPIILEEMGRQFEEAFEKQKEIRKKMGDKAGFS